MASPEVAKSLGRTRVKILGQAEAPKHANNGKIDLTYTGARFTAPRAFEEAGVTPQDVDYASIYDSFTITVVETLEDLGFCEKGKGGPFVADGGLIVHEGKLPVNTDGGGLCNNHPGMGGMMKILEAVRQMQGTAHPAVQVKDPQVALVHGTGGSLGTRMGSSTVILGQEDA
jgi:acetyl-CoA C-acetyltransferase